ncbi:MAG: NAD(P)-dependent oxidoreductase [Candidatus Andersenbacteria bacterium]|nr:NAD(P)-dependent oxidoreductase [bacterium]MDZ4225427.1 NAD(P)-dependent oxidoreductase [Candidatus Andersenbacteria bacterium]
MKLAYFEANEEEVRWLKEAASLGGMEVKTSAEILSSDTVEGEWKDTELLSVFVESRVDKTVLDKMANLKMIATRSTGFDHIDIEECGRRRIVVANVPSYGENTVAEHAFALILSLSRKIFQAYDRTERLNFNREGLRGFDLQGKTFGVIGTGRIGQHSIRIGAAFGMKVIGFDAFPNEKMASELGFTYVKTLDELLEQSDVITLHLPYMPETHHIINKDNITKIKRGAILVNTARGGLIDTEALLMALGEGILSGAGLDVIEDEDDTFEDVAVLSKDFPKDKDIVNILRNHILIARDDVIITPHNAFNSIEAVRRIFDTTIGNMAGFVAGEPTNVVGEKKSN